MIGCRKVILTIIPKSSPSGEGDDTIAKVVQGTTSSRFMSLSQHFGSKIAAFCRGLGSGHSSRCFRKRAEAIAGFTLVEVVMSTSVLAIVFGGIIMSYIQSARRAEWSGYSLAAQALAIQQIEQIKSSVWDPTVFKCEITNYFTSLPVYSATNEGVRRVLDLVGVFDQHSQSSVSGTNFVMATNFMTAKYILLNNISASGVGVYEIRVDTVWPFTWGKTRRLFTNSIVNYEAPDNPESICQLSLLNKNSAVARVTGR